MEFGFGAYATQHFGISMSYLSLPNKDIEEKATQQEYLILKSSNILLNGIYHQRFSKNTSIDLIMGMQRQHSTTDVAMAGFSQSFSTWGFHYGVGMQYHWSQFLSLQAKILHLNTTKLALKLNNNANDVDYATTVAMAGIQLAL